MRCFESDVSLILENISKKMGNNKFHFIFNGKYNPLPLKQGGRKTGGCATH